VKSESAGLATDHAPIYAGRCRDAGKTAGAVRFNVDRGWAFHDLRTGRRAGPGDALGDFVIRKSDGEFGYQLASAVDDLHDGITHVVRGDDLLASTARQQLLLDALEPTGLDALEPTGPRPLYLHVPLVIGPDGRKLGKRHGDTRLSSLRDAGATPQAVLRWLAAAIGFEAATLSEWTEHFDPERLTGDPILWDETRDRPSLLR
jgi:glutamyl-tRNA synthetase